MAGREEIRQRLRFAGKWVAATTTDIFSSDVPESKMRYVVKIILVGDRVSTRAVTLYRKKEDGTYEELLPGVTVKAPEYKEIPSCGYDIESPILTLEGGTNLAGKELTGVSVYVGVVYWDNDI